MTVAVAVTIQGCGSPPAAQSDSAPQASAGTSCRLTVSITTTSGSTWGTVTAASGGHLLLRRGQPDGGHPLRYYGGAPRESHRLQQCAISPVARGH